MVGVGPSNSDNSDNFDRRLILPQLSQTRADTPRLDMTEYMQNYFAGHVQYAFNTRMGVVEPAITEYVTDVIIGFVKTDRLWYGRSPRGERLISVADMKIEAEARQGEARGLMYKHIGDYTLFCMGFIPDFEHKNRKRNTKDALISLTDQGKRSYYLAAMTPPNNCSSEVLKQIGEHFELCVYGLSEVSRSIAEDRGATHALESE